MAARKRTSTKVPEIPADTFISIFSEVPDPRIERTKAHPLETILLLSLCAVVCGADTFVAIEEYGEAKEEWLKTIVPMPNGVPSHDTIGRVFALLDPKALSAAFTAWTQVVADRVEGVVAIDGKTLRRSFRDGSSKAFVHMVSAWSADAGIVLGQVKTDAKSNEITAIPKLLELLDVTGCLVTIDAMGCQRAIAQQIVDRGADYLLAVKGNQEGLENELRSMFDIATADPDAAACLRVAEEVTDGHGRHEVRTCHVADVEGLLDCREKWPGLQTAVMIRRARTTVEGTATETQLYISSRANLTAEAGIRATRSHWHIENRCHWVLDVAFREDDSRVRVGNAAANFTVIRHLALNLLTQATSRKVGIKTKRLRAGWDDEYLGRVLVGRG